jgi:hypothetical protein
MHETVWAGKVSTWARDHPLPWKRAGMRLRHIAKEAHLARSLKGAGEAGRRVVARLRGREQRVPRGVYSDGLERAQCLSNV